MNRRRFGRRARPFAQACERFGATLLVLAAVALGACQRSQGMVRTGPHIPEKEPQPIRVSEPPPPVRVEAIPLRRNKACVYVDGAWTTDGSDWRWEKGSWVLPPKGCYYAPPRTRYEEFDVGTALVYRPGTWHPRANADKECPPVEDCPSPQAN